MSENKLNYNIQYLRGICAIVVFFSHSLNIYKIGWVQSLMPTHFHFFFDGQWAVIFFFTLSGFYYYRETQFSVRGYIRGLVKKSLRIYPPHLLSLIIGWIMLTVYIKYGIYVDSNEITAWASKFWQDNVSLKELLCNAMVLAPHNPDAINPPSWYLSPEVKMFILMPIVVAISNRGKLIPSILLFAISWFILLPLISCIGPFVAGYLLHVFLCKKHSVKIGKSLTLTLILVGCLLLNSRNIAKQFSFDSTQTYFMMIQSMGALCLIFLANVWTFSRQSKVLLFLGNISYEFYILHFIVLMSLAPWIPNSYVFIVLSLVVTLFGAHWMNKFNKRLLLLL